MTRLLIKDHQIYLSKLVSGDKPAMVKYLNNQKIYDQTLSIPFPYTEDDAERFIAVTEYEQSECGGEHPVCFAIRLPGGEMIGACGLHRLLPKFRAEIGYWLAEPYWGRGVMTSVVGTVCDFAFDKWGLVRIEGFVFDSNVGSARVLEKNGFEFEGLLRKNRCKKGRFIDSKLYAKVI